MARNFMTKDGKINRQNQSEIGKGKYNKSIMLFLKLNLKMDMKCHFGATQKNMQKH